MIKKIVDEQIKKISIDSSCKEKFCFFYLRSPVKDLVKEFIKQGVQD